MNGVSTTGRVSERATGRAPGWFSTVWTLAKRELRGGVKGFRVFFLCLVLGVSAIASVGAVRTAFIRGIDSESRDLMGGDISVSLTHRAMSVEERSFMEARGDVSYTASMRSMARKVGESAGTSRLIELKGVDAAYPLFGSVSLKDGGELHQTLGLRDGAWGIVAEETLLTRLGLVVGDKVRIGLTEIEVRGVLTDEPDRVAGGFNYGPRVMISEGGLAATGLVQPGSLITYRTRLAFPAELSSVEALDTFKTEALEAFPSGGWNIQDRRRSAPGMRFFMERVAMFLTMIGLAALIVGGVGVSNAVSAYLTSKREVIATLKCLGADGKTIFAVYLTQVLLMAVGAILVGLAIGAITPFLIGSFLADKLPIPVEFGLYPLAMVQAASFGILITLMFSLWPLGEARDMPPARLFRGWTAGEGGQRKLPRWPVLFAIGSSLALMSALAIFTSGYPPFSAIFLGGTAVAMGGLALAGFGARVLASRLPRITRPGLRLAVSNLHRPGSSTISVVLSMGLGLTLLVIVVLVDGNLDHQIKDQIPEGAPSFFFVDIQKDDVEAFRATIAASTGAHELNMIPNLRGGIFSLNGIKPDLETVNPEVQWVVRGDRALTYAAQLPLNSEVVEGEWWPADYDGPPLVSMEADVARGLGLKVGDTIGVNVLGRPVEATIASLRDLEWRAITFNYVLVFPPSVLAGAPHTWIGNLTMGADDEEAVHEAIAAAHPGVTIVRVKEALSSINDLMGDLIGGIRVTSIVTMGAGILVLAGALAAGHRRRLYDAVVLKVLGARRGFIARAFIMEFALLGLLTALIAVALGTFASWLIMTQAMDTDWIFLPGRVAATIVGAVGLTLGLGMFGTWSALGARPAQHLRSE